MQSELVPLPVALRVEEKSSRRRWETKRLIVAKSAAGAEAAAIRVDLTCKNEATAAHSKCRCGLAAHDLVVDAEEAQRPANSCAATSPNAEALDPSVTG